jgi:hypothetical protein
LSARGVDASLQAEIATFRAEARFLRAYSYYNLMDLFGNVPLQQRMILLGFFTKNKGRGFAFVESELKDLDNSLATSRTNEYGRVDKTAKIFIGSDLFKC